MPVQGKESRRYLSGSHEKKVVRKNDAPSSPKGDLGRHYLQIVSYDEDNMMNHSIKTTMMMSWAMNILERKNPRVTSLKKTKGICLLACSRSASRTDRYRLLSNSPHGSVLSVFSSHHHIYHPLISVPHLFGRFV